MVADGDATLVVVAVAPDPRLVRGRRRGAGDALVRQAALLGWRAEVRPDRATPPSTPSDGCRAGHGVVVLSHDPDVGVPALAAALARRAGYVGALGSRRTQAARRERLLASGVRGRSTWSTAPPASTSAVGAPGDRTGHLRRDAGRALGPAARPATRAGRADQPLRGRRLLDLDEDALSGAFLGRLDDGVVHAVRHVGQALGAARAR